MCEIIERNRREAAAEALAQGRAEGEAKGRLEEKIQSARDFIKDGIVTLEKIKASGRYTEQEIAAIAAP